ncbi:MAG: formylglycine-generating enzyme family protein [Magnetococcus sp. YQC-5]
MRSITLMFAVVLLLAGADESLADPKAGEVKLFAGMPFVWVPGGTFQMGCGAWTSECFAWEKPVHPVTLSGFWLGKSEVTQGQWKATMGANPSKSTDCGNNCPVERVSWEDVQEFIKKLNARDGKFRLPTEAEWEYACRSGGKAEHFAGGKKEGQVAWYQGNSGNKTHQVGTKAPNGLGLVDMSGNIWEWVQDWFAEDAYAKHDSKGQYTGSGTDRVVRGGCWGSVAAGVRCSYRYHLLPGNRNRNLGVRLARSP